MWGPLQYSKDEVCEILEALQVEGEQGSMMEGGLQSIPHPVMIWPSHGVQCDLLNAAPSPSYHLASQGLAAGTLSRAQLHCRSAITKRLQQHLRARHVKDC